MLLEPQPLAEHFAQGVADRVVVVAGDRLDFGPGGAQAGFQGVGGVQQLAHGPLAAAGRPGAIKRMSEGRRDHRGEEDQEGGGHAGFRGRVPRPVCRRFPCRIKQFKSAAV